MPTLEFAENYYKENSKVFVPKCQLCESPMKPHCMFFDETYSEHYYRKETVEKFLEKADCLVVVGTALATNFAKKIAVEMLDRECPVVEINLESAINVGHNVQVVEKSEIALPKLFNEFYRLQKMPKSSSSAATSGGALKKKDSPKA